MVDKQRHVESSTKKDLPQIKSNESRVSLRTAPIELVTDIIGTEIVPYILQFSKEGIVPKVTGVNLQANSRLSKITMVKADGPTLDFLIENENLEALIKIYEKLGTSLGYISKYDVSHNDLHTSNIIVEKDKPFIIDWCEAQIGIHASDDIYLLRDTAYRLKAYGHSNFYKELETAFRSKYDDEASRPIRVTH